jgi:hypothetical protein
MLELQQQLGMKQSFLSVEPRLKFVRSITNIADPARIIKAATPDIFFSDYCPILNLGAKPIVITNKIQSMVMRHSGAAFLAKRFAACLARSVSRIILPVRSSPFHHAVSLS